MFFSNFYAKKTPAYVLLSIGTLTVMSLVLTFAGLGRYLNYIFPLAAFSVGLGLYYRYSEIYIVYAWYLWFFTPLLRRLADYWGSYTEPSPMLLAPFLVCCVPAPCLKHAFAKRETATYAYLLSLLGIFYALFVGLMNRTEVFVLLKSFLNWFSPICFSFYVYTQWWNYPQYEKAIRKTFTIGLAIMGIYGIIQFLSLPQWDRAWLLQSGMTSASGNPDESGGMRIWSTMHSGEPFAAVMSAGLLLLTVEMRALPISSSIVGYLSLLLSTVRSAWLGWAAGFIYLFVAVRQKVQIRLTILLAFLSAAIIPSVLLTPLAAKILERLTTFTSLTHDRSLDARQAMYEKVLSESLFSLVGNGLGKGIGDSGLLTSLLELGWVGCMPYFTGLFMLIGLILLCSELQGYAYPCAFQAIIVSCLVRLPMNGVLRGVSGFLLWFFIGLFLSSMKYHQLSKSNKIIDKVKYR